MIEQEKPKKRYSRMVDFFLGILIYFSVMYGSSLLLHLGYSGVNCLIASAFFAAFLACYSRCMKWYLNIKKR